MESFTKQLEQMLIKIIIIAKGCSLGLTGLTKSTSVSKLLDRNLAVTLVKISVVSENLQKIQFREKYWIA